MIKAKKWEADQTGERSTPSSTTNMAHLSITAFLDNFRVAVELHAICGHAKFGGYRKAGAA